MKGPKELQHNQALLHWLHDLAEQGILTTDITLKIISWNHWLEIHSGLSAKEMIGRNLLDLYPQLTNRGLNRFYLQALSGQVVFLSQRLHGYLLPMLPSVSSVGAYCNTSLMQMQQSVRIVPLMSEGKIVGTITAIEDVTERVIRETELRRQIQALEATDAALSSTQARLQYLLSSSPAVIYTSQPAKNYTTTFISDNVTDQLGYRPQQFLEEGRFWLDHIHPDDQLYVLAELPLVLEKGHHQLEYRFLHQDGTYRWLRNEMKLVENPDRKIMEIVGAWYDITERKRAEEQVREQATLLDIATDAIFVQDLSNRILFWNKGAEHLYGWTGSEVIGKKANQLLAQDNSARGESSILQEAYTIVLEKGEWQGELHQVTKDGKPVIVATRWTLVRDERSYPKSILAVNTDITEKKQLETQFLRTQRMESIGTLASGIAHDINNILSPILGAVKLLQLDLPSEKRQHLLNMIENNTIRGANLVKQVLSFAQGLEGDRTMLQVRHLIEEIGAIAKETFPKCIDVITEVPKNLWLIPGDPTQLHQILMNLCVNARDAMMPQGGLLKISAKNVFVDEDFIRMNLDAKVGYYILIEVADTGTGMSPEILERMFEPFFTTKELGKGTGLGLSTVRGIVKGHQGFLKVYSGLGKGTEFQVYLPAIEAKEIQKNEPIKLCKGNGELIFVVDDESPIREINKAVLEQYGYRVLTAKDGYDALELYIQNQNEIDVVLLDMMMPGMDGKSTISALKKINSQVKIIAVSGMSSKTNIAELADREVKSFLSKPYTIEDLLKVLHKAVNLEVE